MFRQSFQIRYTWSCFTVNFVTCMVVVFDGKIWSWFELRGTIKPVVESDAYLLAETINQNDPWLPPPRLK